MKKKSTYDEYFSTFLDVLVCDNIQKNKNPLKNKNDFFLYLKYLGINISTLLTSIEHRYQFLRT
jgi:hypothetical protein